MSKIIAIDFDGTIVNEKNELIPGAKETINKLKNDGYYIIIWTSRTDNLDEATDILTTSEIRFDKINENKPGIKNDPRKIIADYYIDDKNINGIPGWDEICEIITNNKRHATMKKNNILSRNTDTEKIIIRSEEAEGKRYIEGYAIIFNQRSKLIREWGETFYEVIEPTAADEVLSNENLNVIATVDHDRQKMLGRTKSGTLELIKDERGIKYRIQVPNTTLGNDMAELIERGDYFESSFVFTMPEDGYRTDRSEATTVRYINRFANIYDVAVVIDGAYANTAVALRSNDWEPEQPEANPDSYRGQKPEAINNTDILYKTLEILKLKK